MLPQHTWRAGHVGSKMRPNRIPKQNWGLNLEIGQSYMNTLTL
jgi:hypothetical protein